MNGDPHDHDLNNGPGPHKINARELSNRVKLRRLQKDSSPFDAIRR